MMQSKETPALLNTNQIAFEIGVTTRTVRNYVKGGLLPSIRIGKRTVRYRIDDVIAFLKKRGGVSR
jgi:DNA-binding transcriptional MerR regulator